MTHPLSCNVKLRFLSTLSLRRATWKRSPPMCTIRHFYPRSPCGERPWARGSRVTYVEISIHALLAESDNQNIAHGERQKNISIHALLAESDWWLRCWQLAAQDISIHALLAESDPPPYNLMIQHVNFYPRSPCGERHFAGSSWVPEFPISIHALLAESDSKSAQNSGALLRIWNKFYGDCIFMLTGKAVFYPFCPCFFHIFWCEGSGNFMIAFPSH